MKNTKSTNEHVGPMYNMSSSLNCWFVVRVADLLPSSFAPCLFRPTCSLLVFRPSSLIMPG